jgi:hypothetical protein
VAAGCAVSFWRCRCRPSPRLSRACASAAPAALRSAACKGKAYRCAARSCAPRPRFRAIGGLGHVPPPSTASHRSGSGSSHHDGRSAHLRHRSIGRQQLCLICRSGFSTLASPSRCGRPPMTARDARHLLERGRPRGSPGRIALPVAGDDAKAKTVVLQHVDELGFDAVDAGGLDDSWRHLKACGRHFRRHAANARPIGPPRPKDPATLPIRRERRPRHSRQCARLWPSPLTVDTPLRFAARCAISILRGLTGRDVLA